MFENIIGQKQVVSSLSRSIMENTLPHALLFHGPAFTGKLSAALELSRILTCKTGTGKWTCDCDACQKQRLLSHPDLLLLGLRNFEVEIQASFNSFLRTRSQSSRFLFIRSVRKVLKRFDPVLWEGENEKARKFQPLIESIEENLLLFLKEHLTPEGDSVKGPFNEIFNNCMKLISGTKSENIPVNQIRRAVYWAHLSSGTSIKTIIIEDADKMFSSSANSLLKILEEPPSKIFIVLLTTRRGAILKTLQSRLRPYLFRNRSVEEDRMVLNKIFKEDPADYQSLTGYFLAWRDVNVDVLRNLTRKFLENVLNEEAQMNIFKEMKELFNTNVIKDTFTAFFRELYNEFRLLLPGIGDGKIDLNHIEEWVRYIKNAMSDLELLNISPKSILEKLYLKMRQVIWSQ
ncbi:MAG: hypothetical protein JW969_14675 [Spirochaetales bacterium]|nr:hypothetical protein [Spirochaetales bacterium]